MSVITLRMIPVILGIVVAGSSCAQSERGALSQADKARVIQSVTDLLVSNYVYPETADKMASTLSMNLHAGRYDTIHRPEALGEMLTTDLYEVSRDKHLRVEYRPVSSQRSDASAPRGNMEDEASQSDYGFHTVRILEGNIGYLDLRGFYEARYAEEVANAAMAKLIDTDALIIDLRKNGGGSPSMIQLISSYLFTSEPVHLNTFYWRPADEYTETWTFREVPGKRRPDWDVYVLTSSYTFSAAEEFSYNLKHMKRATLIGETTGGGAHPGGVMRADGGFVVWVPQGRAINPVTGTNWEGVGVIPHVKTDAQEAHLIAYRKALERLSAGAAGERADKYHDLLEKLRTNGGALFEE